MFINEVRGGIPFATEQLDIMLRALGLAQRPIGRFLDLGCGDGTVARAVLSRHPDAQAVLIDFSEPMLEVAREQLPDAIVKRADFGSPDWLPAVESLRPFDAVVSGYAIHHQSDERKR